MSLSPPLSVSLSVNERGRERQSCMADSLQGMSLRTKASGGGHCGYSLEDCVCLYCMRLCNVSTVFTILGNILNEKPPVLRFTVKDCFKFQRQGLESHFRL